MYQPNNRDSKTKKKGDIPMTNKMLTSETNVVNVREEDRAFIRNLKSLSPEKKMLVKGILIGMDLQEKPETAAAR